MKAANFRQLTESPVPVLIDFYADWCAPCRAQAPVLQEVARKYGDRLKVIKINTDSNPELSQALNIRSIPTLMLYKKGEQLWRHSGTSSLADLSRVVEPHLV
jgi:thioredoxin 1